MINTNPKVDDFFMKPIKWLDEMKYLRKIVLDCLLTEELKWRQPCYVFQDTNIILLGNFKEYCSISFFKGTLLQDPLNILQKPGENTKDVRMIKFGSLAEIQTKEAIIKAYIFEAIEIEKLGLKVEKKPTKKLILPQELLQKFKSDPELKKAFEALTPGKQRGYQMYFGAANQSKTISARIERYSQRILIGKGMNDCVCGLSKKMPNCDGSHKTLHNKLTI